MKYTVTIELDSTQNAGTIQRFFEDAMSATTGGKLPHGTRVQVIAGPNQGVLRSSTDSEAAQALGALIDEVMQEAENDPGF